MPTTNSVNAGPPPDTSAHHAPASGGPSSPSFDSVLRARPPKKPAADEDRDRRTDRPRQPQQERAFAAQIEDDGMMRHKEPVAGDAPAGQPPPTGDPKATTDRAVHEHADVAAQSLAAAAGQTAVTALAESAPHEPIVDAAVEGEPITAAPASGPIATTFTTPDSELPVAIEVADEEPEVLPEPPALGDAEMPETRSAQVIPDLEATVESKATEPVAMSDTPDAETALVAVVAETAGGEQHAAEDHSSRPEHDPSVEAASEGVDAASANPPADVASPSLDAALTSVAPVEPPAPVSPQPGNAVSTIGAPPPASQPLPTSLPSDETTVRLPPETMEVDAARFLHRVARAFHAAHERGGEVRLRLSPPELGSLSVEIKILDGALSARVEAESQDARTTVVENLPALRERLAEQGIRIERFDVDLMRDGASFGTRDHQEWESGRGEERERGRIRQPSADSVLPLPPSPSHALTSSAGLNVLV